MPRIPFLMAIGCAALFWTSARADEPAKPEPARTPPLPADLDFVPRKVFYFTSVRPADLSKTVLDAELLKKLQKNPIFAAAGNQGLDELERKFGIALADIDRVNFVVDELDIFGGGNKVSAVVVVAASKAFDRKKILENLPGKAKEEKEDGKIYHVSGDSALYFIDDKNLCAGEPATVRKWIGMTRDDRTTGPLQGALRLAVQNHLVLAINPDPIAAFVPLAELQAPPEAKPILHLVKTRSTILAVHAGKELEVDLFLNFGDARAKDKAVKDLKDGLGKLQEALAPLSKMAADQGYPKTAKLVDLSVAGLKKTPIREEDLRVHVPLYISGGTPALRALIEELAGKVPGGLAAPEQ
jgi:hypothetical protein